MTRFQVEGSSRSLANPNHSDEGIGKKKRTKEELGLEKGQRCKKCLAVIFRKRYDLMRHAAVHLNLKQFKVSLTISGFSEIPPGR